MKKFLLRVALAISLFAFVPAFAINAWAVQTDAGPMTVVTAEPNKLLSDQIKSQSGWVGGDGAYSIKLNDETTLWTFGDSWIGTVENNRRLDGCQMVNNCAATQKLSGGTPLSFKWRSQKGKASSLWLSKEKGSYFWPGDGIALDGKLFVFLHKIKPDKSKAEPFQFRTVSDVIARVDNPLDEPEKWKMTYADLGNDAEQLQFATATVNGGKFVYIYCSYGKARAGLDAHPAILARIPAAALKNLDVSQIEFLCKTSANTAERESKTWSKKPVAPIILFADAAPEMSVTRVKGIDGLVAVYMPPLSKEVMIRHASNPEGPWSNRVKLYDCPEKDDAVLLYSAKTHQELAHQPGELIITYCRNSKEFKTHFEDASIYYPQAIRAKLELPR